MYIYGLFDPRTSELRYVGKTDKSLTVRLQQHCQPAYLRPNTHKNAWIKSLLKIGLKPQIDYLQEDATIGDEEFWIAYYKLIGCELTNGTFGGEGWKTGTHHSEEAKRKISLALKGRKTGKSSWNKGLKQPENGVRLGAVNSKAIIDDLGNRYSSSAEAARILGFSKTGICAVLKGKYSNIFGRAFRYET